MTPTSSTLSSLADIYRHHDLTPRQRQYLTQWYRSGLSEKDAAQMIGADVGEQYEITSTGGFDDAQAKVADLYRDDIHVAVENSVSAAVRFLAGMSEADRNSLVKDAIASDGSNIAIIIRNLTRHRKEAAR